MVQTLFGYIVVTFQPIHTGRSNLNSLLKDVWDDLGWNPYAGAISEGSWCHRTNSVTVKFVATNAMTGLDTDTLALMSNVDAMRLAERNLRESFHVVAKISTVVLAPRKFGTP